MRRHLILATLVISLALAACSSDGGGADEPTDVRPPDDPDAIVLQLDGAVNQPDPLAIAEGRPLFTLYGDGRVIAVDESVEREDRGALLPMAQGRLSAEGVQLLLDEAVARGVLDPLDEYGSTDVADADSVRFVAATDRRFVEFGVSGLGTEDGLDAEQVEARRQLLELGELLLDWQRVAAAHIVDEPVAYTGDSVLVIADERRLAPEADELFGIRTAGEQVRTRAGAVWCRELTGADLDALLPTIVDPAADLPHVLVVRQVFPGEPGCAVVEQL
ncbi:MAG: hypothetical protein AAFZ07_03645 [Actinomycetota bacterium]